MSRTTVSFQGERGAFSELAARSLVKGAITPLPCDSFENVFDAVENRRARYGVIPIENSLVGSIHRNYDLLLDRSLVIAGETQLRIVHCLLAPTGVGFARIRRVYSHPVALDQCRRFFREHPDIEAVPYYDTAGAARMVAESGGTDCAAIAGPLTADLYGLRLVRKSIEDEKTNHTRFLLLGKRAVRFTGRGKTSIVFSIRNQPGALFKALSVFALRDIDLTKIESRPIRHATWRYYFYLDIAGAASEPNVRRALDHLSELTSFLKILGSYPATVHAA